MRYTIHPTPHLMVKTMSLSRSIMKHILVDTPIGVYNYREILFIADYNSGIEAEESFKYPLEHLELRLKLEKKQ